MVTIRLSRGGSKKRPFYSILVADRRRSTRGRFIERVGFYDPIATGQAEKMRIDTARIAHWVDHGAQPSERVAHLLKHAQRAAAKPDSAQPSAAQSGANKPVAKRPEATPAATSAKDSAPGITPATAQPATTKA